MVAKSEYDKDDVAPYVCNTASTQFITKLPRTAILTFRQLSCEIPRHIPNANRGTYFQ